MPDAPELLELFPLWRRYRITGRRFLPYAGGLMDQPAAMLDGLAALDGLFDAIKQGIKESRNLDHAPDSSHG